MAQSTPAPSSQESQAAAYSVSTDREGNHAPHINIIKESILNSSLSKSMSATISILAECTCYKCQEFAFHDASISEHPLLVSSTAFCWVCLNNGILWGYIYIDSEVVWALGA